MLRSLVQKIPSITVAIRSVLINAVIRFMGEKINTEYHICNSRHLRLLCPHRDPEHPKLRWDDHLRHFYRAKWPERNSEHWLDILLTLNNSNELEMEYVEFMLFE